MQTTNINEIEVNGVPYVRKDSVKLTTVDGPVKIVILQRGWIMIGRLERNGNDCKLHNASVIRAWGTSKGLGELAGEGPKVSTKLDPCNGVVEFDYLTVVAAMSCVESKWPAI